MGAGGMDVKGAGTGGMGLKSRSRTDLYCRLGSSSSSSSSNISSFFSDFFLKLTQLLAEIKAIPETLWK